MAIDPEEIARLRESAKQAKNPGAPKAQPGNGLSPAIRGAQSADDAAMQGQAVGGLRPKVQPGYSSFAPTRDLQRAQDSRMQSNAIAADKMNQTVSNASQGAIDDALAGKAPATGLPVRKDATAPVPSAADSYARGLRGAGEAALGVAAYPALAVYDGVRNAAGSLAGGDTSQIKQTRTAAADVAASGFDNMQAGAAGLRENVGYRTRQALGIDKAPVDASAPAAAAASVSSAQAAELPNGDGAMLPGPDATAGNPAPAAGPQGQTQVQPAAAPQGDGYTRTGYGIGRQGGEIVMRQGADGVPEFTNAKAAQDGASAMPAGGLSRVGDGQGGTFSVGEPGDAQRAIATFERANQERGKTIDMMRSYEGGGVKVIGQKMSLDDVLQAKLGMRNRALDIRQGEVEANAAGDAAELGLRGRELEAQLERQGIEAQAAEQDLERGDLELRQMRGESDLLARIQDPNTPAEEREQLTQQYRALNTAGKDRYFLQDAVLGHDSMGTPIYGKQVVDTVNGKVVNGQGQDGQAAKPAQQYQQGKVYKNDNGQRALYKGQDESGKDIWEEI